jgi:Ca-activated chloride channel family protein
MAAENNSPSQNYGIEISISPSTRFALRGVRNDLSVAIDITTKKPDSVSSLRPPLNLAIVLDKSGSMRTGGKLNSCKQAICKVIESLRDDDVLHLIAYDTNIDVIFENQSPSNSEKLKAKVNQIAPGSSTNLWGGLEQCKHSLPKGASTNHENRIMLFSDGLVNEGRVQKTNDILDRVASELVDTLKAKVSSFGVGDDFNEELMKGIAETGLGTYFFIESSNDISKFVNGGLRSLLEPSAFDATVCVRGRNSGIVREIHGHPDLVKGASLGDLRVNNTRTLIVELDLSPSSSSSSPEVVLHVELTCRPVGLDQSVTIVNELSLNYTDQADEVERHRDKDVTAKVLVSKTARIDEEIQDAIKRGDKQGAISLQKKQIEMFQSACTYDESGKANAELLLKDAESSLLRLEDEGCSKSMKKKFHQRGYMKRRNSAQYYEDCLS